MDYSYFEADWDPDHILQCLCDLPDLTIEVPTEQENEVLVPTLPTPRTTARALTSLQQLQKDVEKIQYQLIQQAEELAHLKHKVRQNQIPKENKNIIFTSPSILKNGQGQSKRRKTSEDSQTNLSSPDIHHYRKTQSGRFERVAQRNIPQRSGSQSKL